MYIYENHRGGLFCSAHILEDTCCSSCGDCDIYLGEVNNRDDIKEIINKQYLDSEGFCFFTDEYIEEFIDSIKF